MMGNVTDKGEQQLHGIIPRSIAHIFQSITNQLSTPSTATHNDSHTATDAVSYAVGMSYFEIYNEKVYDLLAASIDATRAPLDVRETPDHQTYVDGLTTRIIGSTDDALRWIERGNDNRRVAATAHNVVSSRSHGVIQMTVERKTAGGVTASRLSLVDLAGSERYDSATHGSASREGKSKREEMSAINKSLNTLSLVVNALTQQQQRTSNATASRTSATHTHIPYRNSTLTHLLKDSLGGHSKAAIIACINPTVDAAHESTNTLKWASNAKRVHNSVKREEERNNNNADNTAFIQSLHAEIEKLKRSERVEKCKRYRVYDLLPEFAMKVLEHTGQPDEEALVRAMAADRDECKEQPSALLQLGEEKLVGLSSESDESALSLSRRSSADLSVRLHDTLLESTVTLDSTLDSSTSGATSRRAQLGGGVFASPSRLRWKVVRETFSSENARQPLDEVAGGEAAALFSPASQRRLEKADEEFEQRRAGWQREKERQRLMRNEKRRESVQESEKTVREAQRMYDAKCKQLDDVKAAYEEERSAKEEERQRLLHQLDTAEEHSADKDEEIGRLLKELAASEARIIDMQQQHAADKRHQSEALAGTAMRVTTLQACVQEAETERFVLQQRIAQVQSELHASDAVRLTLQAKVDQLTLDMASRHEQQRLGDVQYCQQLDQLGNEVKRQQAELNGLREELATEQAEHAANKEHLQHIAARLQRQLDEAQQQHDAVQAEAAERYVQYQADQQTAQRLLDDALRANQQAAQAAIDQRRTYGVEQSEKIATLQTQLAAVREQLTASEATLNAAEREHRADRIRLMQQFDAQLHAEQQRQRNEQQKSDAALQRRRQVEKGAIDKMSSLHHQQLDAAEQQVAAVKAELAEQQQLFQAEAETRSQQHDRQLTAIQQQHEAELTELSEANEASVEAMRARLQAQVTAFEVELAAAKDEALQQSSYQEAEMAILEQRIAATAAILQAEYESGVAALKASHEQANGELERQLAEQTALSERLHSQIRLVEATLAQLNAEAETTQQQLGESQQRVVELQAMLTTVDTRHQREIEHKNVQLLTTTYIACAAQTALKRRTAAYDAAAAVIARLEDEKGQLCEEMSALQVDMAAMQATHELQLDAKDEQLASRINTIARLQGSGEEGEADRVALHQRIDQLQDAMIESEAHRQHLLARLEMLQASIRQKDELLAIVQADAASQRAIAEASHERAGGGADRTSRSAGSTPSGSSSRP